LLLAFFGISALALLSAIASIYALSKLGDALSEIAQNRMPAALVVQEISQQAERIVAAAPALLTLNSVSQQEDFSRRLAEDILSLNRLLSELKGEASEGVDLDVIESSIEALNVNLVSIDTAVYNNAVLSERKQKLLDDLFDLYTETRLLLAPAVLEREETILDLKDELEDPDLDPDTRAGLVKEYASLSETRASLIKSQFELLLVKNMLLEIASTKQAKELQTAAISVGWSIDSLEELAESFDENLRADMLSNFDRFRELLSGADSIVTVRQADLKGIESVTNLLSKNAKLSRVLTGAVADLVSRLRQDVTAANADALAVQRLSINVVIGIVALSILSVVLIVWLYVGRNLIRRLTALSESMLAIAGGNLRAPLPTPGGSDEISQMAEALVVFRDTAVEVEMTNLREIDAARRRLVDAIESISEGFSLYDADDRLVVSNSTYCKLLYPGIEDVVMPGVPYETIVRKAAERGLVAGADGRVDEWVADRLAKHRNPGEPHLQQQSDGRWILINERKTDDGSTVAVYEDITELKQREEELSVKSSALEQLSTQLAKYLSPQVYDSIFSGKQEVKVTSNRKKLTIFFSDIADFTETADRLESEELAQLLNHYLTEMSQIALDHGATIDKYVGDAILAFFGDPETNGVKEDAFACVNMAIAMRNRMHELSDIWRGSGIERPLRVRMGIHTGYCTVGNFGSENRMDYTIIGGAVNTASRLETLATPGEILISYETYAHVKGRILCENHGEIEVKGIAYPIATYQVIDSYESLGKQQNLFREDRPNVKLDLDLAAMSADDRSITATILRQALDFLSEHGGFSLETGAQEPGPLRSISGLGKRTGHH
jgi:class 3 adenylate cyclase/HAMP domain-containing protein